MVFSSPTFLFCFLPLVLLLYYALGRRLRNLVLLLASLLFYAWGEPQVVLVMLASIGANFGLGLWVERLRAQPDRERKARGVVALAVVFNLALLTLFKYSNFLWDNLDQLAQLAGLGALPAIPQVRLPIGISFFTFQALSYVVDVYRLEERAQRRLVDFALYIASFPQLIAGPIVRYRDVARQLVERRTTTQGMAYGIRRFVIGLGKKMLIANTLAVPVDRIFDLPSDQLTTGLAWFAVAGYSLQLYFDFSGYSDMAIGLGHMFGFRFLENFNYPYVATTITELWRRWHISLSSWLRDYLYIPLGGNRRGPVRTYFNLIVTFLLCGLWHGAAWNFVMFGGVHGSLMVLERLGLGRLIEALPAPLRRVYFIPAVMLGWLGFRGGSMAEIGSFLGAMSGLGGASGSLQHLGLFLDRGVVLAFAAALIGSVPWLPHVIQWRRSLERAGSRVALRRALDLAGVVGVAAIALLSAMELSADTYNPFIYFRF